MDHSKSSLTTDSLKVLIEHHRWATGIVLDLCKKLSGEQFHQRFAIGLGSLHDNLVHLIGCVPAWIDRSGGAAYVRPVGPQSIAELRRRLDASLDDLEQFVAQLRSSDKLHELRLTQFKMPDGSTLDVKFIVGTAIIHSLVHGTHHRAQCLNMLRQLGVSPLPDIDVIDWHYLTETKGL
jgi:uncharacterized damage-inducible protein DinB